MYEMQALIEVKWLSRMECGVCTDKNVSFFGIVLFWEEMKGQQGEYPNRQKEALC